MDMPTRVVGGRVNSFRRRGMRRPRSVASRDPDFRACSFARPERRSCRREREQRSVVSVQGRTRDAPARVSSVILVTLGVWSRSGQDHPLRLPLRSPRSVCWRRSCSPTSSRRPNRPRRWVTGDGGASSTTTTQSRVTYSERFRGPEMRRTGDGFLATFDSPARALRHGRDGVAASLAALRRQDLTGLAANRGRPRSAGSDGSDGSRSLAPRAYCSGGPNSVRLCIGNQNPSRGR